MISVVRICPKCGAEIPADAPEGGCPGCLLETALDATGRQIVFGRYTLVKVLGRGGMGTVWLVRDEELERDVALKFLPDLMIQDHAAFDQLRREAKRCLELTHPHIVRIHDFVHDERSGAISMEYIDGETLSNLRAEKEQKAFDPDEIADWISQVCDALDYAHNRANVIHCDLKPANLMVNQRGDLKISDFGIARSLTDSASRLTVEHGRSGTLVYMSPQQLNGARCTYLDDIYSLGATIYELLTSEPPFNSGNIHRQICKRIAPPMTERRKELDIEPAFVPQVWEDAVAACLAKDRSQRPQSAAELAERLQLTPVQTRTKRAPAKRLNRKAPLIGGIAAVSALGVRRSAASVKIGDRNGSRAMQSRRFSGLPLIGILAVIYFIAGKLGLMLASLHASASPVWPPAGIALAALLLLGYRAWPAIFIGAFLVNVTTTGNVATSFAIATGNTLEALVGAWLVNRFAGGTNVFDRSQGVFKFALAAGISTIISPAFGLTSLGVAGFADWANYGAIWLTWWLGDATGDLVFTPLVLLWSIASKRRWNKKEAAEVGALLLLLMLLSGVVFGGWPGFSARNYPIVLICGPVVIWTAFRFAQRETATGIFILSAIAVWGTLHGFGPFVTGTENQSLLTLQWWTAVLSITAMALSAGMAERRRVEEVLQQQKVVVESANRTKDHSLTMLSHELRTPPTPVMSALEPLDTERAQTNGDRSVEPKSDLEFEIAHLLSIDVAGYSKLSNNEQIELLEQLNQIVRSTECFRSAEASGKLNRVPTGDGMALLFSRSPEEPVRCALEISRALQDYPRIRLRMGVHSGPVSRITDVNDKTNFAGSGMNVAQRVLDCGDAGHILLSAHVAEDLAQYRHWQACLHDLGECDVKHGLRLHLFNLCEENLGNPQVPEKLRGRRRWKQESDIVRPVSLPRRLRSLLVLALVVAALAMVISSLTLFQRVSLMTRSTPPQETASKGTVLIPEKSIAILPFQNLSDQKEDAYFADGVQDEILTDLAKIADLKVISRMSTMQYKTTVKRNVREIANALGVAYVLEGTVQRAGGRVRVSAQLIDARTDSHLWAERYDRDAADVFAIESELAGKIVAQLQAKISPSEKAVIEKPSTTDLAAYELYLRAQELFADTSNAIHARQKLPQAAKLLDEAVARDPRFLQAWCLLSRVHSLAYFRGHDHTQARLGLAKAAFDAALRLQPDAGETHLALAIYYYSGFRDYGRARNELVIARRALPNSADVFRYTGMIDRREGHWEEATRNLERALELDPRNFFTLQQLALAYGWQHRYADSARVYDRALTIVPADPNTRILRALIALNWRADIKPFQTTLATLIAENPNVAPDVDVPLYAMCERTAAAAARTLTNYPHEGVAKNGVNYPYAYWQGAVARCQGDLAKARTAFAAARKEAEKTVERQPDFAAALSLLGMIDAGLGRKEEALREGRRGCELLLISKDAIDGTDLAINLAQIYAWTGEKDRAIEQIAAVERVPNSLSYGLLKLHPYWDSLRGDPRFEKIVASLAPK